ncbi:MAG: class I SAM-dependent methyltransferase [Chlamydiota bacterium]
MNRKNPLEIVSTDNKSQEKHNKNKRHSRQEAQANFDRLWLQEPERFDVTRSARERTRVQRTIQLLKDVISPKEKTVADIGCGSGVISKKLRDEGATVDAVDVSQNALKELQTKNFEGIHPIHDYMPNTNLKDSHYDIVLATELIADIPPDQYRIFFSELARVVNAEGYVICSTPIDIQSENALERFAELASTEFNITKWTFSYHYLQIKFLDFFKAPHRFVKASKNKIYREKSLNKRYSLSRWWFKINSTPPLSYLWIVIKPLMYPFCSLLEDNETVLLNLEKVTKFFWKESGISQAIFIAKRKPIIPPTEKEFQPKELKHKKQVWE